MTAEEVEAMIDQGEGPQVEFKREFTTEIDRTLAAFANTQGGTVLIGVDDEANVLGVAEDFRRLEGFPIPATRWWRACCGNAG